MQATYNVWLVLLSIIVAMVVSYTALTLAGRVAQAERSSGRGWLFGGAAAMGIGIWSMHFIGMLAFSVPIPLRYNILTTPVRWSWAPESAPCTTPAWQPYRSCRR
jgi:NO-binding membrane sensor protein with MHYT domain